jgi:hypothetical protein
MKQNSKQRERPGSFCFLSLLAIVLLLFAGSCGSRKNMGEKNMIPEKDLVPLLTDIYIANGLLAIPRIYSDYSTLDSNSTYTLVIEKHGYTKEMMDKTMKYYFIKNPKKLNKIYDQVLGILSNLDSRIEKEALIEQSRISNLFTGKDFYVNPSLEGDSTRFEMELKYGGFYSLAFSATLYPDDQSDMPRAMIYSFSTDSLGTGNARYFQSPVFLKDGQRHNYVITIRVADEYLPRHLVGWLYNGEYLQFGRENHFLIEDISLSHSLEPL